MIVFRSLAIAAALLLAGRVAAADFHVSDASADPGQSATVQVGIMNSVSLTSGSANLNYDETSLTATIGTVQPGATCSISSPGVIAVTVTGSPVVDGVLCNIDFLAAANASPLDYPLFFNGVNCTGESCGANTGFFTVLGPDFSTFTPSGTPYNLTGPQGMPIPPGQVDTTNTGTTDLTITPSGLSLPLSVTPSGTQTLAPSGGDIRFPFDINCDTTDAGNFSGTLTLTTNDPDEPTHTYPVTCTVSGPEVGTVTPVPGSTITLTTTPGVATSSTITIVNSGTSELSFSPGSVPAPFTVSGPGSIPPGLSADVTVGCNPPTASTSNTPFTITTGDASEPSLSYTLVCAGGGPEFDSTPPAGGTVSINTSTGIPGTGILTIRNLGTSDLTVTVPNPMGVFTISPSGPTTIAASGTQDFTVSCSSPTPQAVATPIQILTNDSDEGNVQINLACNVAAPEVDAMPPSGTPINIAPPAGQTASQTVRIFNFASGDLVVTPSGLSSPLSVTPAATQTISGDTSVLFTVSCDGAAGGGTFQQTLSFSTNDPDEPTLTYPVECVVPITAMPEFEPSPPAGTPIVLQTTVGQSTTGTLNIANIGSGDLIANASGLQAPLSITPASLTVAGGDAQGFVLRCAPTAAGTTVQTLAITTNDPDEGSLAYRVECVGRSPTRTLRIAGGNGQFAVPNGTGTPLSVEVLEGDVPVAGETITWTTLGGSGVVLSAPSSVTDATGRAQVGVSFGGNPTLTRVQAADSQGGSVQFTINGPATDGVFLAIASGTDQRGAVGSTADAPIVFETRGGDLQPRPGVALTFSVVEGSAVLASTSGSTDAEGRFALNFRYGTTAGLVRIRGTVTGTPAFVETTATAVATRAVIVSGNNQSGSAGAPLPAPLVVGIEQLVAPKGLAGVAVTWTVLSGGGTVTPAAQSTDPNGRAAAQWTLGPGAGTQQARATVAGAGSVTFTASAVPTGTIVLDIVSGNDQALAIGTPSAPLVVAARNNGTPAPGLRVAFTPGEGVSLSATEATTDSEGRASVIATLTGSGGSGVLAQLVDVPGSAPVTFALGSRLGDGTAGTPEQQVGDAIDASCPALSAAFEAGQSLSPAQQDLLARCRELLVAGGDTAPVAQALDELLADEVAAQTSAALTIQSAQFGNLKARLAALRSGTRGASFGGLAIATPDGALPLSFLPSTLVAAQDAEGAGTDEVGADFSRWGFFATGTIGRGSRDETDLSRGFDFDTYGLTAGVDYRIGDSLVLGAALGLNRNDTQLDGGDGSLEADGYNLSAYATWFRGGEWYVDGVLTFGRNTFELSRRIQYEVTSLSGGTTRVDQRASASPDADQTALAFSVGRDFSRGAWSFGPYLRATYTRLEFDGYLERMSDPDGPGAGLALAVEDRSLSSLEAVLGGKMSWTVSTGWGVLMPHVSLEWLHELEDDPDALVTRFASDPTQSAIVVDADPVDDSYFNLGLGLSGVFANGRSAFVYYEHRAGQSGTRLDNIAIGVRIEF